MGLRIVHVGLGGWGQDWAVNAIPRAGDAVDTVAWVDADPVALAAAQQRAKLPARRCFPTLEAALNAVKTDAVLVTAPISGHVPLALEALAAGKHVLVEKPFTPSVAEARQVVDAAAARGLVVMVSQNYRFFPAPRAVAALLASGELGTVDTVTIDFRRDVTTSGNTRHHQLTDPLLVDMAIHHFDLLRMVLGQSPTMVFCHAWNPPGSPFAGDAAATATVAFDGGAVASWRGNWVSPGERTLWAGEWRIECGNGEIRWTSRDELGAVTGDTVIVRARGGKDRKLTLPEVQPHGRAGVLVAFAKATQTGTEPETSGRDNLGTLALVVAAVASAGTRQPVQPAAAG